ncbi:MAG: ATP-binding cassette domain-containing protein [Candidatus Puniceispirillum sp.]|nr:ATP-binding cassette domain-containing protein [Candidatus Puniceispirillum sp.]MBL6773878.1 ATP-binding cassette domain-containing protein [Candidatus Puniceispirillum sp.]
MTEMKRSKQVNHDIIRRIWQGWIAGYLPRLIVAFLLMIVVAASASAYPLLTKYIFNGLAEGRASQIIWMAPPVIILFALVKGTALFAQTVMVNALALRVSTDLQKDMAKTLIEADLATISREPAGVFMSRIMNDLNLVREALVRLANNLVRDSLTIVVLIGAMIWLDWVMALVVIGVYPLAMGPIIRIGNRQRKASGNLQTHMESVTSLLAETLNGARMVKAYQREDAETGRTHEAFDGLYSRLVGLLTGRAKIDPILEVVGGVAVGGVVALASWRVANGDMQVGDVIAFITTLILLVQPVRAIGTLNAVTQEGLAACERILTLLDTPRRITDRPHAPPLIVKKGHLVFDNVSFTYNEGSAVALDGISFTAKAGQTIALVGPSGAGKTTVINLLPRFFEASSGVIKIDDQPINDVQIASLRRAVALVSQESVLFDDTVAANIGFGRADASRGDIEAAARAAAADSFIEALPNGYETMVGAMGNRLSGGQRQRIAIARAMLKDAPILLLDEATAALDAESEQQVQAALQKLQAGRTTLVVAHRLATVRSADLILVLEAGRITEQGTHDSLMAKNGLYSKLCQLQFFDDDATA